MTIFLILLGSAVGLCSLLVLCALVAGARRDRALDRARQRDRSKNSFASSYVPRR